MLFAVPLFTAQVYWSFLDKRIKDKKALLSFLEPAYTGAFYAAMGCLAINFVLVLAVEFATTIELPALLMSILLLVYLTFLSIPKVLVSNLKTSIEEEAKNASKTATCNTEVAGQ